MTVVVLPKYNILFKKHSKQYEIENFYLLIKIVSETKFRSFKKNSYLFTLS